MLDVINSGEAWAFIGSGPSNYAGAPSWRDLVTVIASEPSLAHLYNEPLFTGAFDSGNYARCFGLIEAAIGRLSLEDRVRNAIEPVADPADLHRLIADLPFKGYITTNYDGLLERALSIQEPGWITVGNTSYESRKITGDASRVVWHLHGAAESSAAPSRLVLTTEDYDNFYLEESFLISQLRALMAQRRVVIIGFGLADQEIIRLLKRVGRMTQPSRPIFALLPQKGDFATAVGRKVWLHESNIDVIPYRLRSGGHQALKDLLEVYSSLSLRRSLKYHGYGSAPPSYDPETTGLLIYNELVLARHVEVPADIREALLQARILSQLHKEHPVPHDQLINSILEPARRLSGSVLGALSDVEVRSEMGRVLAELCNANRVHFDDATGTYSLTATAVDVVANHAAVASRMEAQFSASLKRRAAIVSAEPSSADRIARAAEAFVKDCIEKRALGVAMAIAVTQAAQHEYHLLALLQSLSIYLETLEDEEEARSLIRIVEDLLRAPSDVERTYIGVALQARFGLHLLGYDDITLTMRMADAERTMFIIDSTALIGFLARSSPNSEMSISLMKELGKCGASIRTTSLLADEVAEHIQWAQDRVTEAGSFESIPVLEVVTGRAGQRSNAFLEGFAVELAEGRSAAFNEYVKEVCSLNHASKRVSRIQVTRTLDDKGVAIIDISQLTGFGPGVVTAMNAQKAEIQRLRETAETFTREVQVKAEAEALAIVQGIRAETLQVPGASCDNAYFVSNTRIIDQVAGSAIPVTMKPEAVVQWLVTLHPCSLDDLGTLTSGLLWELQERGLELVNSQMLLTAFSPLIEASELAKEEQVARLRALTGNAYAGDAEALKSHEADLDLPVVIESYNAQRVRELEESLEDLRRSAEAVAAGDGLSETERRELEWLREKERKRIKFAKSRARLSSSGGRRRRRPK
jgi:hypothetical protein